MTTLVSSYNQQAVNSLPELPTENFRDQNIQVIKNLRQEFGVEIAQEILESISEQFKASFNNGSAQLGLYLGSLRAKGHNILVEKVKEGNVEVIQDSSPESEKFEQWLNGRSNLELIGFIEGSQPKLAFDSFVEETARIQEQEAKIAQENSELINQLKSTYSEEVVEKVFASIREPVRKSIEQGKLSLQSSLEGFKNKCEQLRGSTIGKLPEGLELQTFLQTAKVTKYIPATHGTFFITGTHKGLPLTIVVKATDKPVQEFFANTLYSRLLIKTPKTQVMGLTWERDTATKLKKVLNQSAAFKEKYPKECPKMFLVMSCIEGTTLENWKVSDILDDETGKPYNEIYDKVLVDIGQIAAADYLLYYRDRLPTIGAGNLANLMIHKDEQGKCVAAVAIDQVASLNKDFKKNNIMGIDPFEHIGEILAEVMSNPSKISSQARAVFGALPESIRQSLDEQKALEAIQNGIILGLAKVAKCTPGLLDELQSKLPTLPQKGYSRDGVDLNTYKAMLEKIKELVLKQSSKGS